MAVKLKEIHRLQKGLYGDRWPEVVMREGASLQASADKAGCTVLAQAVRLSKDPQTTPERSLLLLAVAVEI